MLKAFLGNKDGNVAMMFGATALLLLAGVGAAIDYSSMNKSKTEFQAIADAAVLMAASSGEDDPVVLQDIVDKSVAANNLSGHPINAQLNILEGNTLRVEVSAPQKMLIMGMFGASTNTVRVGSEAPPKGNAKLNLALVLDVTGSMEGTRMASLKTAATQMIDDLDTGGTNSAMVSVVPFSHYVKLSTDYSTAPWIEVEPTQEFCWDKLDEEASTGCAPDPDDEDGDLICTNEVHYEHCQVISWWGCMGSRAEPWDKRDYYGGVKLQGFTGGGGCHSDLHPLSTDLEAAKTAVLNLDTDRDTYIPAGLMWGWRTLSPDMPFTEADTPDKHQRKSAMLLMSDGENTKSYGGTNTSFNGVFHWESDQADADADTAEICANIKNDGIIIYTVAFEVTDTDTIALLRNCATDVGKFFDAANAAQLTTAFQNVGKDLAQIRLSK